ncbi:sensor histidine kinase [Pedosphaera parvula]|uniref:histidine kinase n=1 Tax=Pedosphaera parvula (strain Ellin514) TaxID=320771 RepID=B9XKX1_PEDPL|nr:sensor histidine kinase [Pedosphaera parvula]EEF59465.1 integral membrane sensor signal transduction histidine kinase [Pedosphaera parvula Ellin514]
MNFPQLAALFAVIANLALTFFVLSRDLRSVLNRVYFMWGMSVTIWNLGAYYLFKVEDQAAALYWAHFLQFGVIFLPVTNLHLCLLIARISIGPLLYLFYALHFLLAFSLFSSHYFIQGVHKLDYANGVHAYYSIAGPFFFVFLGLYAISTSSTMLMLYYKQRTLPQLHRARLRSLMLALGILIVFGTNDLLPILRIDRYPFPFNEHKVYPFGNVAAVFYVFIIAYSVLQHKLLDIHLVMSRFAAQVVRVSFMMLLGFVLLFLLTRAAPERFNNFSFFGALGVLLVTAIVASILFPRFFGRGEEALERRILGDRFEYHDTVQALIRTMRNNPEPKMVLDELRQLLVKTMRVQSYQIILLDESTHGFSLFHSYPARLRVPLPDLQLDTPIFQLFTTVKPDYLACKIAYAMPGESELERGARKQLKQFDPEFCFALFTADDPFGLLLIGPKESGEPYTQQDLRLMTELVQNLSLILNQVRLKNQIHMAQEQELLGRMSRGLAHDLNNLLTPAQTFLQLFSGGTPDQDVIDDLLPVALRNVETVRSYVKEALFFSNTHSLQVQSSRLDETIRAAVELMEPAAQRKGVELNIQGLTGCHAEMDEVLIQRMMGNLISNAIDASPRGSAINIRLLKLPRTEFSREWYRLEIIDSGDGISAENLKRVFQPYFSTKNVGDERRGFGLGLAIARKIMNLHGGNLNIVSEEKKGTTVQVDLPSRRGNNGKYNPAQAQVGVA